MQRIGTLLAVGALVLSACGAGAEAPPLAGSEQVCTETFCAQYPAGWNLVDRGDTFISLSHPDDPETLLATVGPVNMEGLVVANGGTWPQTVSGVVEAFWRAADGGEAELATSTILPDGSVESFGVFRSGRMWARLIPLTTTDAIGVEMRAPNRSWESHAEAFLDSVVVVP
ncbi:MAG: hypothetical protein QNJ88_07135 [Acidimicrobiia bacterium]|nr:hypothetical protein [Acidimicrobiia bacterium]